MSETAVFELAGISKRFHQGEAVLEVLDKAELAVQPGELVALVGPSGSGKSTLLQIAGLLDRPDDGEVRIEGKSTQGLPEQKRTMLRRQHIGFVYQFHHLLPEFSAQENIILPQMIAGKSKSAAKQQAKVLLDSMGLGERMEHRPAQLSGGEQQRVAIARALANDPAILLADEPTGNLDPETSEKVFGRLVDVVRQQRVAGLIATHNHQLALKMDRLVQLEHGKLIEVKKAA